MVDITPAVGAIFGGSPDAESTPLGIPVWLSLSERKEMQLIENAVTHLTFETGSEQYKDLETSVFVAAGRFVIEKDKPVVVEYKVSRVRHG